MWFDYPIYRARTKYASPRLARADASRDPDTQRVVDRMLKLDATRPENARALDGLTPRETAALERLHRNGLAYEAARDLWWLHPLAWDPRFDNASRKGVWISFRQQVWISVVLVVVTLVLFWLEIPYMRPLR